MRHYIGQVERGTPGPERVSGGNRMERGRLKDEMLERMGGRMNRQNSRPLSRLAGQGRLNSGKPSLLGLTSKRHGLPHSTFNTRSTTLLLNRPKMAPTQRRTTGFLPKETPPVSEAGGEDTTVGGIRGVSHLSPPPEIGEWLRRGQASIVTQSSFMLHLEHYRHEVRRRASLVTLPWV